MKKAKRIAAALLACALLSGCGGGNTAEAGKTEAGKETAAVSEKETTTAASETEETAAPSQPVVSDNEFIREVEELLAAITPLEPYVSIRPEEVPENAESDFEFQVSDPYTFITGYKGSSTQVKIPANLGGGKVLSIDKDAFRKNEAITWLYLPDTVKSIDKSSFSKCTALQEVYIAGVDSIDAKAFEDCTALRRVEIGGCKEINARTTDPSGAGAFCGCTSLEEVVFPVDLENMGVGAFEECIRLKEADLSGTKLPYLSQNAFLRCYSLESISLPETMAYINGNACLEAYSLKNLQFAEGSTFFIEDSMVYGYQDGNGPNPDNLECVMCLMGARASEIHIKDGTKTLSFKGIAQNPFVKVITVPDSVTRLEGHAFFDVDNLERLELGSGLTYMDQYALFSRNKKYLTVTHQGETYEGIEAIDAFCETLNQ